jgi:hypothetical protein
VTVDGSGELAAVAAICSPNPHTGQTALPLGERVAIVAMWLMWGGCRLYGPTEAHLWSREECAMIERITGACGTARKADWTVPWHHPDLIHAAAAVTAADRRALADRFALIRESQCERYWVSKYGTRSMGDARDISLGAVAMQVISVVRTAHVGVSTIGYSRDRGAPVFVAIPPNCAPDPFHDPDAYRVHVGPSARPLGRKVTIATCSAAYLDVAALKAALNAAEAAAGGVAKWGGPSGMCCSPMAEGTVLDDDAIIAAVCAARVG